MIAAAMSREGLFARRLGALAIDALLLAALLWGLVTLANTMLGARPFYPFWATPALLTETAEVVDRDHVVEAAGVVRDSEIRRETRVYADGTIYIYAVIESRFTHPDGTVTRARGEYPIGLDRAQWWRLRATEALFILLPFLLGAWFEGGRAQATPGKRLFGLIVETEDGRRMEPWRALSRQFLKLVEIASTGLGYFLAGMTDRRQALHDILTKTRVIARETRA